MPFPGEHYLLSWGGPLRTAEAFSQTLRFNTVDSLIPGTPDSPDAKAWEEDTMVGLKNALSTWWATGISGTGAVLSWVKFNRIGSDGKYVRGYTNQFDLVPPIGPANATTHPNQVALVVTLETGLSRGLAHRGRMFFPIPRYPIVATDGVLTVANADAAAVRAVDLLEALRNVAPGMNPRVFSSTREGGSRLITGVSVGRVLDTMRSRRAQLEEDRRTAALAAVP